MLNSQNKYFTHEEGPMHNIIIGAENNDFTEVDLAISENPNSIIFQDSATGMTALHVATGNGSAKMVDYLLSKPNVNPSIVDKFNRDALDMAISIGHEKIIDALSKKMYPKSYKKFEDDLNL